MAAKTLKVYEGKIQSLKANQVFVFGSNLRGFHGAGSAGDASFGVEGNKWRDFEYDKKPHGWKGKWNVKGVGRGFQQGTEGASYALPTVVAPGMLKSIGASDLENNIVEFYHFAFEHPELEFLVAYSATGGTPILNGYTIDNMAYFFGVQPCIPLNVVFEKQFISLVHCRRGDV